MNSHAIVQVKGKVLKSEDRGNHRLLMIQTGGRPQHQIHRVIAATQNAGEFQPGDLVELKGQLSYAPGQNGRASFLVADPACHHIAKAAS